jgi:indolepyruvate decarboxylase
MLVSKFLIERLVNAGVKHFFGVTGDYIIDFYKDVADDGRITIINNTDENHSGFAADAYARVNGIGCAVVTYSVGASKVINAVQCAYAERSPLIIISGAPGVNERNEEFLLHHIVRHFNSQKKMFDEITCASVMLDNPATAGFEIDKAFEALQYYKRPIYIELPRDIARQSISYDVYNLGTPKAPPTDPDNLEEAIKEVKQFIEESERPAILAGVELARYKLSESMVKFAEKNQIPIATTMLSKSVVNEKNPLFAGVYLGPNSAEHTRKLVEESDCLLVFGDYHHDMTLCFKPCNFTKRQIVWANIEKLKIRNHVFSNIQFTDFCKALFKHEGQPKTKPNFPLIKQIDSFEPKINTKITSSRLFAKIDSILNRSMAICADIGDSLFGATGLTVHHSHQFLSPAFYSSMGAAIPYALGVQTLLPDIRPIVIVGDGAFQMSCTELSTMASKKMNPIIFVLNNDGYTTERYFVEGKFNDLNRWNYHKITELFGFGKGLIVYTEEELEESVKSALDSKELFVINVILDRTDVSEGLKRMTESLSRKI